MKIKILKFDEKPLTLIGQIAGICYGQTNPKRFENIAKRCLNEGHMRVSEYTDMIVEFDELSAKVVREMYTSTVGISKLQASTRYIDYSTQFDYVIPNTVKDNQEASKVWFDIMGRIKKGMLELKELGIPTEDYTNLLPLAYETKTVFKINLRALINMMNTRLCTCAYIEYRNVMKELKKQISELSDEWKYIADNYFVPKCIKNGYCDEVTRSCKLRPLKK